MLVIEPLEKKVGKIVIAGDGAVGKTTIAQRLAGTLKLEEDRNMTCGIEFHSLKLTDDGRVKTMIWDLGGQEQFHFFHEDFFKDALVVIIVFSVEWYHSFLGLDKWISMIPKEKEIKKFLVANKIDSNERAVSTEEAARLASENKMEYHELSAITGDGFKNFTEKLRKSVEKSLN
ncbi:MAG: GTP-binding protein [Candidatus Lokiarchaeota archaeon]|nr:GTP-binding protein [Candidatus Lokiarchaeota archaeon]